MALYACTLVPIARPKLVRAVAASDAPVPPCATAISVAAHVPVPIVPTVVVLVVPAYVDIAVFSTDPNPTSPLTNVTAPVLPATEVTSAVLSIFCHAVPL